MTTVVIRNKLTHKVSYKFQDIYSDEIAKQFARELNDTLTSVGRMMGSDCEITLTISGNEIDIKNPAQQEAVFVPALQVVR